MCFTLWSCSCSTRKLYPFRTMKYLIWLSSQVKSCQRAEAELRILQVLHQIWTWCPAHSRCSNNTTDLTNPINGFLPGVVESWYVCRTVELHRFGASKGNYRGLLQVLAVWHFNKFQDIWQASDIERPSLCFLAHFPTDFKPGEVHVPFSVTKPQLSKLMRPRNSKMNESSLSSQ